MTIPRSTLLALLCVGPVAGGHGTGCGWGDDDAAAAAAPARSATGSRPVVLVELFTSQGCSSCPPADQLLGQLPGAVDGIEVLPLAFHVDYWNDLGWSDPFSRAEWTARQKRYVDALADGRIYTPQLVVQGSADVVGSDRRAAVGLIRRAASRTASPERARIQANVSARPAGLTVVVDAALGARRDDSPARADVWVALVESGLTTPVKRGENEGRSLVNHFVVRRLTRAFELEAGASRRGDVTLALEPGWRSDRLAVTVFLQDRDRHHVLAAAAARPR